MPERPTSRAFSANRQGRQRTRGASVNATSIVVNPHKTKKTAGNTVILPCIDLRTMGQKIEDLKKEIRETKYDSNPDQNLHQLILMQVYINLEYGDISIENARAYLNISKFYFHRKNNFLPQAKFHALSAREILEHLHIQPTDGNLKENLLAYEIYLMLIQCSLNAKQRETKSKNKHILSIDKTHIDHDLKLINRYLEKLKHVMNTTNFQKIYMDYVSIKFDTIMINTKDFNNSVNELIDQLVNYFNEQNKSPIDLYLRCGCYFLNFNENIQDGLMYYRKAVELADEQEKREPSKEHKQQLAHAILQRNIAKVRIGRLTEDLEKEFQRAIQLYQQPNEEMNKNVLKVIDELATFYTKKEKYQDALNVLCESLPDKIRLFGDFSEEVIQTESRIGAIYLREGESLNAIEHLKTCLDLQVFVYGPNDPRTYQTRNSVELLKKDPLVSQTRHRPVFRISNKISHEKSDLQLFQKVTKKTTN